RRFDLVYARVGKAEIDASRNGRFSVAAEQGLDGLAITWRLSTSTGESLRLQFSSGQEYDVIMRDDAGRVVWQWSAGRVFTQDFHERSVSVWSASVLAPIANLMAGTYKVEAWITTSGNPPAFAATVPVLIRRREFPRSPCWPRRLSARRIGAACRHCTRATGSA
ncbi:MAG: hypothetical protein JWP63_2032, partial [Candidatus Solibacter sp.]|nr:hypothetical protein [Candidatus Solibacter sp.]